VALRKRIFFRRFEEAQERQRAPLSSAGVAEVCNHLEL